MISFIQFIKENKIPASMSGVHPEVWKAHVQHQHAEKKHYEYHTSNTKRAATRTFRTLQKKLDKHEPDKSKHLKIMTSMNHHYSSAD